MSKTLLIAIVTLGPSIAAQTMGADPEVAKMFEMGANGGFFILALYWMRSDWDKANVRLLEQSKDALARLERAYTNNED